VAVDGVRVDVLVNENRRSVRGLTAANFELRDRGVVQVIDSVSFEDVPVSVMLVLVFSDAADTASSLPGARVIELVQRHDAVVYGVTLRGAETRPLGYLADSTSGIQAHLDNVAAAAFKESFIERLTGESGGSVFLAEESGELRAAFEKNVADSGAGM
jgi:hypothetical protein